MCASVLFRHLPTQAMHTTFVGLQKAQPRTQIDSLGGLIHADSNCLWMEAVFDWCDMSLFIGVLLSCVLFFQMPLCALAACASLRPYAEPSGPPSWHKEAVPEQPQAVPQQGDDCPMCTFLARTDFSSEIPAAAGALSLLQPAGERRLPQEWKNPRYRQSPLRDLPQPRLNVLYSTFLL